MRSIGSVGMKLYLILFCAVLVAWRTEGFCAYFTVPESKLLDDEFSFTHWGPAAVTQEDGPGTSVQFCFTGLTDSGSGLKDDYPADTVYGQIVPSHANGDFSLFSSYALQFENLDTESVSVSIFINTGFTGPSGIPSNDSDNDTFWQSAWTEIGPGERKIISLYFDYATPWNIEGNPPPHTQGTNGVPTSINDYDRAEVSAVGFEVAGPDGNSQATLLISPAEPSAEGINSFIFADRTLFKTSDTGKPWFYAGTNNYYVGIDNSSIEIVDEIIADMKAMKLNVLRLWGFNDDQGKSTKLQGADAGDFIESNFQMLDYVLHKANENGIRVIIPLINYWDDYGGMQQYVNWNGSGTRDDFYANSDAQDDYYRFISYFTNRVNTINGRIYKNDPTILAWQLANEPRYKKDGTDSDKTELTDWIHNTADYLKNTLNVYQIVTIGMEGFYGTGAENSAKGGKDGFKLEQTDYIGQHADSLIDLAGFHIYQDHWGLTDTQSIRWIAHHIRDARRETSLGKPVIMDEFGRNTTIEDRNTSFMNYLDTANRELVNGTNFWILYHDDYPDYDGFGVYYPNDIDTVAIITNYAHKISLLNSTGIHQLLSFEYDDENFTKIDSVDTQIFSVTRVAAPSWRLTDDGSVKISGSFNAGGKAMIGAELNDPITGSAGIDISDYGYTHLIARIRVEENPTFDPHDLRIKLYDKTTSNWTYASGGEIDIGNANLWYECSWPIATTGDLSDVKEVGIDVFATGDYTGIIYVDLIGGDLTTIEDNLLPEIDLDGNGTVNWNDIYLFAGHWLYTGPNLEGDVNDDQVVNFSDLAEFAALWKYP